MPGDRPISEGHFSHCYTTKWIFVITRKQFWSSTLLKDTRGSDPSTRWSWDSSHHQFAAPFQAHAQGGLTADIVCVVIFWYVVYDPGTSRRPKCKSTGKVTLWKNKLFDFQCYSTSTVPSTIIGTPGKDKWKESPLGELVQSHNETMRMVNGKYLYSAFNQSAVQSMLLNDPFTHSHQQLLAAMQGTNQPIRSILGLGALLRDTSTHAGQNQTCNPLLPDDSNYLLSQCRPGCFELFKYCPKGRHGHFQATSYFFISMTMSSFSLIWFECSLIFLWLMYE